MANRKPGIKTTRRRPQRDAQGRFAAKVRPIGDVYETFYATNSWSIPKVSGVELGQHAKGKGPNAYERLREWLGSKCLALGAWLVRA